MNESASLRACVFRCVRNPSDVAWRSVVETHLFIPSLPELTLPSEGLFRVHLRGNEVGNNVSIVNIVGHEVHDLLSLPFRQVALHNRDQVLQLLILLAAVILNNNGIRSNVRGWLMLESSSAHVQRPAVVSRMICYVSSCLSLELLVAHLHGVLVALLQ